MRLRSFISPAFLVAAVLLPAHGWAQSNPWRASPPEAGSANGANARDGGYGQGYLQGFEQGYRRGAAQARSGYGPPTASLPPPRGTSTDWTLPPSRLGVGSLQDQPPPLPQHNGTTHSGASAAAHNTQAAQPAQRWGEFPPLPKAYRPGPVPAAPAPPRFSSYPYETRSQQAAAPPAGGWPPPQVAPDGTAPSRWPAPSGVYLGGPSTFGNPYPSPYGMGPFGAPPGYPGAGYGGW